MMNTLRLPLACDVARLQADLAAVAPAGWHPHFNTGYYEGDWSGIPLRGQPGIHVPLYSDPTRTDFADLPVLASCAYVPELLAQLECPLESVRFLKLAAGASIREHRDFGLAFDEGAVRLHVPVHTHPDVRFELDGELVPMVEGEWWYVNFDRPHRVTNAGPHDRVHLVIDARVNAWLTDLFHRTAGSAVP
jgi:aspartyl/asparaginyl beta-hydroxylase